MTPLAPRLRRLLAAASAWLALAALVGCAHPISLTPDASALVSAGSTPKIERKVGLVVTEDQRKREVIGPGGGGDKVNYFPYKDLEVGLYAALTQVYSQVSRVQGAQDPSIKSDGVQWLFVPEIQTTSFSPSLLTWPPTVFTITLECTIRDATSGQPVTQVRVQGEGRAEFDEFKSDFSLSAKRAANDALKKLIAALREASTKLP
jgi:hypothetical protein